MEHGPPAGGVAEHRTAAYMAIRSTLVLAERGSRLLKLAGRGASYTMQVCTAASHEVLSYASDAPRAKTSLEDLAECALITRPHHAQGCSHAYTSFCGPRAQVRHPPAEIAVPP